MTIASNTIVKDGMPFIGKVLDQVEPFMHQMIVTLSAKSADGTVEEVHRARERIGDKMTIFWEDVRTPGELTKIRNDQSRRSPTDWILFLDDDDYWPEDQLTSCLEQLDTDPVILAYSVRPYQLIDELTYDYGWRNKWFSKFLRRKGLQYVRPWPRDLPADKNGQPLYWKTHPLVKNLPYYFYHLSYLKQHSFRKDEWAKRFVSQDGRRPKPLPNSKIFRMTI